MSGQRLLSTVGSYFTPQDGYRHAIVSTADGEIHEIFYNPGTGKGNAKLACFCGARLVTAFFTPDDGYQHPIVATDTGDIFEIFYQPNDFHVTGSLATFPNMVALSGFYAADDRMRILIVGQANGSLHEVFYNPAIGVHVTQPALATFAGLTHVTAFYSGDDTYRHAIVATVDGNVTEVFYHPTIGVHVSQPPLANFKSIVSIAAFYAEDDHMRIVIVATADGAVHEVFYRPDVGAHVSQPPIANIPGAVGLSAFYTADDKFRHVLVADTEGALTEIFYNSSSGVHVSQPPLAVFPAPAPRAEAIGPDLATLDPASLANVANTSPAGRSAAIGGTPGRLYTLSHTGGVFSSVNGGSWSLQAGSPAPANLSSSFTLAVSTASAAHAVAGNDAGLWETTDSGMTWAMVLDPVTIGAAGPQVLSVAFDDKDRLFVGLDNGIAIRSSPGATFQRMGLGAVVTAISVSDNKVWARTASSVVVSTDHGTSWSSPFVIPATIKIRPKEEGALAATDGFAYMVATLPGETGSGCAGDNVLVILEESTGAWSTQRVLSTDLAAWHTAEGKAADPHTCDGTGGDSSADGRRFVKSIRLRDTTLSNVVGERIQIFFGAGQEVWRARGQAVDGTITDWNWMVGTQGGGFTNRDPVHADIWDFHVDPTSGGRTAWVAGDGGIYSAKLTSADYEFTAGVKWQPAMAGLHTHQIQTLTLLRTNQVGRPRLAYAIGDSGAFYRETSPLVMPEMPWTSLGWLGDGNWSAGDSSAPLFAQLVRNLTTEAFLRFGTSPFSAWIINPKLTSFVDPATPTRFRFVPSPWQTGQFESADVAMMVDLPLTFQQAGMDVPFPTQPGPSSGGAPVLIRNRTYDSNPDINAANAKGKGWAIERAALPKGTLGFAVSGDRTQPVYYTFSADTLFAERSGNFTPVLHNLVFSQRGEEDGDSFGPVFPNPYDSTVVYALTSDNGVQASNNAGSTFFPDAKLNALVGPDASLVNQIAFNYDRPSSVAACTQAGQVFFSPSPGVWRDLSSLLPLPLIPINSVAIDCEAIYLGTFGRGLMCIIHYT